MISTVTSVKIKDLSQDKNTHIWMYECITYKKGFKEQILFTSGLNHNRDGAVHEVLQFLKNHSEYINEWVN